MFGSSDSAQPSSWRRARNAFTMLKVGWNLTFIVRLQTCVLLSKADLGFMAERLGASTTGRIRAPYLHDKPRVVRSLALKPKISGIGLRVSECCSLTGSHLAKSTTWSGPSLPRSVFTEAQQLS